MNQTQSRSPLLGFRKGQWMARYLRVHRHHAPEWLAKLFPQVAGTADVEGLQYHWVLNYLGVIDYHEILWEVTDESLLRGLSKPSTY